jgi:hypothetical protein
MTDLNKTVFLLTKWINKLRNKLLDNII